MEFPVSESHRHCRGIQLVPVKRDEDVEVGVMITLVWSRVPTYLSACGEKVSSFKGFGDLDLNPSLPRKKVDFRTDLSLNCFFFFFFLFFFSHFLGGSKLCTGFGVVRVFLFNVAGRRPTRFIGFKYNLSSALFRVLGVGVFGFSGLSVSGFQVYMGY